MVSNSFFTLTRRAIRPAGAAPENLVGRRLAALMMAPYAAPAYRGRPARPRRRPLADMEASLWLLTHPDLRRVTRIRTVLDFVAERLLERRTPIEGGQPS